MRQCWANLEASAPTGYERRNVHQAELTTASASNPFDARGPFLLSLFMTLVGYSVLVALPAINSAWVDQLGFTEVEVNRVASSDLLGLSWRCSFRDVLKLEPSIIGNLTQQGLQTLMLLFPDPKWESDILHWSVADFPV